jgi:hypothetical protein
MWAGRAGLENGKLWVSHMKEIRAFPDAPDELVAWRESLPLWTGPVSDDLTTRIEIEGFNQWTQLSPSTSASSSKQPAEPPGRRGRTKR